MADFKLTYAPLATADYRVSSPFGYRNVSVGSKYHKGIDLVVDGASNGTVPVIAVASGTVTVAGWVSGYGNAIYIDHGNGVITIYGHLDSLSVSAGQIISAGTQLGYMGNTGVSSGTHLHFSIQVNGELIDPAPYLEGGTLNISNKGSYSKSISSSNTYSYEENVPYSPSAVVGRRVSDITSQPLHAYLNIYIGDKLLTTNPPKPNYIQSFEIQRMQGVGDTATFVIFDDNWYEIEKLFADNWKNIKIQYGYSGGLTSAEYNMMLQTYSISFNSTGIILSVQAMSVGAYSNLTQQTVMTNTSNPTEAIMKICEAAGFEVSPENFDATESVEGVTFNLLNDFPITYIFDVILPVAQNSAGNNMQFYIDSNNKAYLKEETFIPAGSSAEVRTYIFQKGYDSVVEDFVVDIKGVFGGTTSYNIETGAESVFIDTDTKEENSYKTDTSSVVTDSTGDMQFTYSDQSIPNEDSSAYPVEYAKRRIYYKIKRAVTSMYEATLTILGDPTIKLFDDIRVMNVTDDGYLHHTSGIYKVMGIIDSINNGVMTTTLKLLRNGAINQGVEVINPKTLVK